MAISFKSEYQFPEYLAEGINAELIDIYDNAYVGRTVLSILGSYWGDYYKDLDSLHALAGAVTPMVGEQFQTVLHQVLSSSITDIPVNYTKRYELFAFNSQDALFIYSDEAEEDLAYIEFDYPGLEGIQYLSSGLFNSTVILDSGNYFSVEDGKLRFYVNIFEDTAIRDGSYVFETFDGAGTQVQVALFWASTITVTQTYLYDRFGRYLYHKENNSESYKAVLTALQFFYTTTKSVHNLENVLNILFQMPFSKNFGEVVESIDSFDAQGNSVSGVLDYNANATADTAEDMEGLGWYLRVETTHATYFVPMFSELLVSPGDTLEKYQLISRVHRVKDYVTDPDWYADSRFPFELVEYMDDYSVIETPPEFEMYRPQQFDGDAMYDGGYLHTGEFATYGGINPFMGTRSKEDGSEFEQFLYGLMDSVLKFNLLYLQTNLNYENIDYYKDNKISDAYQAIASGVPTYLYPVMETAFHSDLIDRWDSLDDEELSTVTQELEADYYVVCPQGSYDGSIAFSNPLHYIYSGDFTYDGATRMYPYGGPDGAFYDCQVEDFNNTVQMLGAEDFIHVLGIDPDVEPTYAREEFFQTHDGTQSYSGDAPFWTLTEGFETALAAGVLEFEETVDSPTDPAVAGGVLAFEDSIGGYSGEVGFNNVTPLLYGADFTVYEQYTGAAFYDGTQGMDLEIIQSGAVRFDGVRSYNATKSVQYTYGSSLPKILNIRDEFEVNFTYAHN